MITFNSQPEVSFIDWFRGALSEDSRKFSTLRCVLAQDRCWLRKPYQPSGAVTCPDPGEL